MRPRTLFATGTKFDRTQLNNSLLFNRLCIIDDLNLEHPHLDERMSCWLIFRLNGLKVKWPLESSSLRSPIPDRESPSEKQFVGF